MPDASGAGELSPSAQSLIPPERAFQVDPNGLGGIAESVNLFRGDVNVPVTLVSLTSRGGIDASLTLVYNSNVLSSIDRWNLDAPTGPIGLGWSLGYDFITRDATLAAKATEGVCYLIANGASNRLFRIAETPHYWEYEAESYQFWQIRYYPAEERWVIIREDGTRYVYGGQPVDPHQTPVQYAIKWGGALGNWTDSSVVTRGQALYPIAWNLAEIQPIWGDGVRLEYSNERVPIGATSGLLYTKASRLRRVVVPHGYTLTLNYQEKVYNDTIREYQIPHIEPANPLLHAFQDRYETHYLASAELRNAADAAFAPDALLQRIDFNYELVNMALRFQGNRDFYKRYLTAINYRTSGGLAMPNMTFSYLNDPARDLKSSVNRGALRSILYPQGGRIEYSYTETALTGTARSTDIASRGMPRIWFGPDYTVVVNDNGTSRGLVIRVFAWNGSWVESPASYTIREEIDLATLDISAQAEFFALRVETKAPGPTLRIGLFHKAKGRYGGWVTAPGLDVLPLTDGPAAMLATGSDFAVAVVAGGRVLAKVWDDRTSDWIDRSALIRPPRAASYALAATGDYIALAAGDVAAARAELRIWYRVRGRMDFAEARIDVSRLDQVAWDPDGTPANFWSLGSGFACITYFMADAQPPKSYMQKILQWNDDFAVRTAYDKRHAIDPQRELPYGRSIASSSVVGNAANLLRFDGERWQPATLPLTPGTNSPRFVYGSDMGVMSGATNAAIMLFDAYKSTWRLAQQIDAPSLGILPTINGNYVTSGREVFYRAPTNLLQRIATLPNNVKPETLVNRAPWFIAYEDSSGNSHVLPLANGECAISDEIVLPNQKIYVPDERPGTGLVGPASLVTYTGDFDRPGQLRLYRFVNQGISGRLSSFLVTALAIDDGYPDIWGGSWGRWAKTTRYYFDADNVTISPDGSVTEFAAATAVYGVPADNATAAYPPPVDTPFGRSEYRYHNDRAPLASGLVADNAATGPAADYYSFLNGMLFDKTDYDSAGAPMGRVFNLYDVRTEIAPIDNPAARVKLIGGYIKRIVAETSQYEHVIEIIDDGASRPPGAIPDSLRAALEAQGVALTERAALMQDRTGQHLRLFPDREQGFFVPVRVHGGKITAAVAVTRSVWSDYSLQTGLLLTEATSNYNSVGKLEHLVRAAYYVWQIAEYALFRERHIWAPIVASIKFWREDGQPAPGEPREISLVTYREWYPSATATHSFWAPARSFAASSAAAYDAARAVPVRFDDWTNTALPPPSLWVISGDVVTRDSGGSVTTATDPLGRPTATHLNRNGTGRVAEFVNARIEAVAYCGFERYEELVAWRVNQNPLSSGLIVRGDAHTGSQSFRLDPGGQDALETELLWDRDAATMILSCWVKTSVDFNPDAGDAIWEVSEDGAIIASFVLIGTDGEWGYRHFPIRLQAATRSRAVTLRCRNRKTKAPLLIDDIMVAPLIGSAGAVVYDDVTGAITATVDIGGGTTRNLLDSRGRAATGINAAGSVSEVAAFRFVRQHDASPGFAFPTRDPNATISITAVEGGGFANFTQGEEWKRQWEIDDAAAWLVSEGSIEHVGAAESGIAFKPSVGWSDHGVRMTVTPVNAQTGDAAQVSGSVGVDLGTNLSVRWAPGQGWTITLAGIAQEVPNAPLANDWTLLAPRDPVSGQTSVLFFADGQLLFSALNVAAIEGAARLIAAGRVVFSAFAVMIGPAVSITYYDGSGKERQTQNFTGTGVVITGSLYDPIGRAAIGIKPVKAEGRAPGYDQSYVETFDPTSGVMTGRAASAYPDDEGYPYVRTEFFRSAQSLAAKQGAPGKVLSVRQTIEQGRLEDLNAHIQRFEYGTNIAGRFGGGPWPASQYFVTRITDPNGHVSATLTSKINQKIATLRKAADAIDDQAEIFRYFYDGDGRLVETLPPAGVDAMQAGDPEFRRWASRSSYDFLGHPSETQDPDSGITRFVFDTSGQLRFSAGVPEDGAPNVDVTIVYAKYDELGRQTEQGGFTVAWDYAALQRHAQDPNWPDATQPHQVAKTFEYDGNGDDPTAFGQVVRAIVFDENGTATTIDRLAYDLSGQVVLTGRLVPEFDQVERMVGYAYDNAGQCVRLTYPNASDVAEVTQDYDRLGQVFRMGQTGEPAAFGAFSYTASGTIETSTVPVDATRRLTERLAYGPPGWPTAIAVSDQDGADVFTERLAYIEGGFAGAGYFDGKIAKVATTGRGFEESYRFAYDALSRLRVAERGAGSQPPETTRISYDRNGNFAKLTAESTGADAAVVEQDFHYRPYSDRLLTITSGGTAIDAFRYNVAGAATHAQRRGLSEIRYDRITAMTSEIALAVGHRIDFGYDSGDLRCLKTVRDARGTEIGSRLYVRGVDGQSLQEVARGAAGHSAQFIYGPAGLTALWTKNKRYVVVRDHLGSVRRVVDETGTTVAIFDYTAFGATISRPGAAEPDIIYYRYTGQELDPESGLYNYQARFYDPELGRFVAVDPQHEGASPYIYVLNNPISLIDPEGEEALTAFLIIVLVAAIIGAVAGGITYALTHEGNFDVGKFFLYVLVGGVAGAIGGATGYAGGLLATSVLATIGVSTSTSIASGIIVGAVVGATDGVVSGVLNQVGVNLIEGRDAGEDLSEAAWKGAAIGGAAGGALGGITGAVNYRTASKLARPTRLVTNRASGTGYANFRNVPVGNRYGHAQLGTAAAGTTRNDVIALVAHGARSRNTLRFVDVPVGGTAANGPKQTVDQVANSLGGNAFTGGGIDLSRVCHAGSSGVARSLANTLKVPVRAATSKTTGAGYTRGFGPWRIQQGEAFISLKNSLKGGVYRTYYPSKLRTGWNYIFGY